jgi:hypothetical protein
MKINLVFLILLLTFKIYGQTLQELDIKIIKVDTTQPLFDFITFDKSFRTEDSVVVIKQLWVNKNWLSPDNQFEVDKNYTVIVDQIGPDRQIFGRDTLELRGHARIWDEAWLVREKEEDDQMVIQYFELKKIKKNGG